MIIACIIVMILCIAISAVISRGDNGGCAFFLGIIAAGLFLFIVAAIGKGAPV